MILQQNISLDDQYILTVGVRRDFMRLSERDKLTDISTDDDFSETSFRGAFTYKVTDEWSTYISYVESVATPKIGTQPERGEQREIGAKYSPNSFNALFSATVYDLNKKDVNVAFVDDSGVIEYKTVGESNVKGLDLELKTQLFEDFDLTAGYSYMESEVLNDGSDTSIKGKEFTTVPNHTGSLWGHYTFLNDKMSTGLGARYIGEYYFNAENTSKSEAATLFDASLSYQFAQATTFSVNVSNLFDKQYVVGSGTANYYNPSREVTATFSHAW